MRIFVILFGFIFAASAAPQELNFDFSELGLNKNCKLKFLRLIKHLIINLFADAKRQVGLYTGFYKADQAGNNLQRNQTVSRSSKPNSKLKFYLKISLIKLNWKLVYAGGARSFFAFPGLRWQYRKLSNI